MPPTASAKKRKVEEGMNGRISRPKKKVRKQQEYHSSSSEAEDDDDVEKNEEVDFRPVDLADSDEEASTKQESKRIAPKVSQSKQKANIEEDNDEERDSHMESDVADTSDEDVEDDDEYDVDEDGQSTSNRKLPKRNDPTAFSTSISKILATKLPTSARADPVLSRSREAVQSTINVAQEKLDRRAKAQIRAEKLEELDRGRIRDVLGIEDGTAGATAEEEKRLRKIAQRGVVKLFNAIRAAQVRGEEAAMEERRKGTVGMEERKKAVTEVSKQGFLDLINGKKGKPLNIEEA